MGDYGNVISQIESEDIIFSGSDGSSIIYGTWCSSETIPTPSVVEDKIKYLDTLNKILGGQ